MPILFDFCPFCIFYFLSDYPQTAIMHIIFINKEVNAKFQLYLKLAFKIQDFTIIISTYMTEIKVETIEKNFDQIIKTVGDKAFVDWEKFSHSSAEVINLIEQISKKLGVYRECQHRNFIQSMKKLKSLDLPDLIRAVKSKTLPKQALRSVVPRFKSAGNDKIELIEPVENLKANAVKEFQQYLNKNNKFIHELKNFYQFIDSTIKNSGFAPERPEPQIKATVKFNLSEQQANKIASKIKKDYIPGTNFIGLTTYNDLVQGSFDLIKAQNHVLTTNARIKQRQNIKENDKYLAVMNEYLLNSQALIIEAQKLIAKKMGLSDGQLQDSEVAIIERGYGNHIMYMQSTIRAKIKQSIPPTADVPYDLAKEIITFQTNMLNEKKDYIKSILDHLEKSQETIQSIPMLLALILNDMVFEKYKYEEEDFMKNVSEEVIAQNPDLSKIFQDMEIGIIKLMEHIGVVTPEVGKYLQQGAAQRLQNQPQNQQSPVLIQQMTPTELLQMQQKQQMQQMLGMKQPPV